MTYRNRVDAGTGRDWLASTAGMEAMEPHTIFSRAGMPRGVLNHAQDYGNFSHSLRLPSADLAWIIEHYWMVSWSLPEDRPFKQETVPHPTVHFVLEKDNSLIFGVVRKRFIRMLEGRGRVFGLKFKPGCFYPFLKSPVSKLTNRTIPPADVFGPSGEKLEGEVLGLDEEQEMLEAAERFLRSHMPEPDPTAIQVSGIVDRIRLDRDITSVEHVIQQCNISIRALQRLFDRYVGVSPKWVIRIYRLHEMIQRLESGEPLNLAALSQDLGYFDQSHFVRDFKSIAGRTPTQQIKNSLGV